MSTKLNANLNAIELTQAELDSITGGDRYPQRRPRPWYVRWREAIRKEFARYI
jgi:hypothetical protein